MQNDSISPIITTYDLYTISHVDDWHTIIIIITVLLYYCYYCHDM